MSLGAEDAQVESCDQSGIDVHFVKDFDGEAGKIVVTLVEVTNIDQACAGLELGLRLTHKVRDAAGNVIRQDVIAQGFVAQIPSPVPAVLPVDVTPDPPAHDVDDIHVDIESPLSATPTVSISDAAPVNEPAEGSTTDAVFTVNLSSASGTTVTVDFQTADGTARAPIDYVPNSGRLTFPPGVTAQNINVMVNGDAELGEGDEDFFVRLTNAANATFSDAEGMGIILAN